MSDQPRYDRIGSTYSQFRRTEPTWMVEIVDALGDVSTVLNVGAGTGNYEPVDRTVIALEPSPVMLGQRRSGAAPAARGVAEALPFADGSFDAVMGVLTMHHWTDRVAGMRELQRVAPRQVLTVYEPIGSRGPFWLLDYFPAAAASPMEVQAPTPETVGEVLNVRDVRVLWVPQQCQEGFAAAYWAQPERYLDPAAQQAISLFAMMPADERAAGFARLASDLDAGIWHERYGHILDEPRADFGYRLVIAGD